MDIFNNKRTAVKIMLDISAVAAAVFLSVLLRFDSSHINADVLRYFLFYSAIYLLISGAYKNIAISWSYTDSLDVFRLITIHIFTLICMIFSFAVLREDFSRQVTALVFVFSLSIQLLMRMFFRMNRQYKYGFLKPKHKNGKRALIYGAGEAGITLVRESKLNKNFAYNILGLIDDDPRKQGIYINGIKVYGNKKVIKHYVQRLRIEVLILAIPSLDLDTF